MVENQAEIEQEEVEVAVIADPIPEESQPTNQEVNPDDELDQYTKNVSKRINKLNQRARTAEEINALRNHTSQLSSNVLLAEEQSVQAKELQANELYKKAVESGDAELMSKADTLKSELSIQKEKLRIAKNRQTAQPAVQQQPYQQPYQQQPEVQPTQEAQAWSQDNPWYGDDSDSDSLQATQFAYFTHFNLINEGYEADSDDYYDELNERIFKVYPNLDASKSADKKDDGPPVQRVASTSVGSRQKTQGKKNGVTFSKSEVDRLRGLKPYNMSEEDWLKRVAKEKQKIAQKEAR